MTLQGTGISSTGALRSISGDNTWQGTITANSDTSINSDSGTFTLSGAIYGGYARAIGGAGDTVISGAIGGGASGTLTKDGTGTLTLSASNTYTGATTVSAGTLSYGASNITADTGGVTVWGGTLNIGAYSDTVGTFTLTTGAITGTTGVLTGTAYSVRSGTISAVLGGAADLTKTTQGTVVITSANTYTGATIINGGVLSVSSLANGGEASNIGASTNIASKLRIDFIAGNGSLSMLRYTGATVSTDRLFTIGTSANCISSSGTGGLTFSNTGSLSVSSTITIICSNDITIASVIGGSIGIYKEGSGTLTLTGDRKSVV